MLVRYTRNPKKTTSFIWNSYLLQSRNFGTKVLLWSTNFLGYVSQIYYQNHKRTIFHIGVYLFCFVLQRFVICPFSGKKKYLSLFLFIYLFFNSQPDSHPPHPPESYNYFDTYFELSREFTGNAYNLCN